MSSTFQDFMGALYGGGGSKRQVPLELASISQENIEIVKSLIALAKRLEQDGQNTKAIELKQDIQSLLDNNKRLIDAANQALGYGA